jgi:hypothetical protein
MAAASLTHGENHFPVSLTLIPAPIGVFRLKPQLGAGKADLGQAGTNRRLAAHSLVIRRDVGADRAPIRFDDEHWKGYVPIRLPSTLCVQERLPAGAAGVLLNRSHPFHDLILPVGAPEKRMFDAIDGRRTIEEIADVARGGDASGRARTFFEKLWSHDQVTFDASTAQRSRLLPPTAEHEDAKQDLQR